MSKTNPISHEKSSRVLFWGGTLALAHWVERSRLVCPARDVCYIGLDSSETIGEADGGMINNVCGLETYAKCLRKPLK